MNNSELHSGFSRQHKNSGANLDGIRTTMRRPEAISGRAQNARKPRPAETIPPGEPTGNGVGRVRNGHPPCPHPFMNQLEGEKRRANRTKGPLSIVLFRLEDRLGSGSGKAARLFETVCGDRREIDIPARLADDLVAILLPETNEDGAWAFTRKILDRAKDLEVSVIAQSYPGHLFDNLLSGERQFPDPTYLALYDSAESKRSHAVPNAKSATKQRWLGKLRLAFD